MEKIELRFLEEFRESMLSGKKRCTTRRSRKGYTGDTFEAFGNAFVLQEIREVTLSEVAFEWYKEEGFSSPRLFIKCWIGITGGYYPNDWVFQHFFIRR